MRGRHFSVKNCLRSYQGRMLRHFDSYPCLVDAVILEVSSATLTLVLLQDCSSSTRCCGWMHINPLQEENPSSVGQRIRGHLEIDAAMTQVGRNNCHNAIQS